jgi:hypothetical protein
VYLESVHVFKRAKFRNTELDDRSCGDNDRDVMLKYVLIFSPFFERKTVHLVCEADMESECRVVLCTIEKYFVRQTIAEPTEFHRLILVGGHKLEAARKLGSECSFVV